MRLIEDILSQENINNAIKRVKSNGGCAGIDKMKVDKLEDHFKINGKMIINSLFEGTYKPQLVKRVYIPKPNGKQRPLGIPTATDRVIQQAIAQKLSEIYEPYFSDSSCGFRPNRDCHLAMSKVLEYLNEGYEWIVDLDIEKYFDTVNHDKLISTLRERVNDSLTLSLIRKFLRAGIMDTGLVSSNTKGMPQGGPLSPILSNIYLDKFDKELEQRGLKFVRYADDCIIFVKSELAANRVIKSVTSWLERKLFLKVNVTKSKVVRPTNGQYLGFTFWKHTSGWKCRPINDRKAKLISKVKEVLIRRNAVSRPLSITFTKLNQIIRGWINYFRIGSMKQFLDVFGQWLRHKVRVIIIKQWKKPLTIYNNLHKLNKTFKCRFNDEAIYKVANSRLGWYRRGGMDVINFLLSPKVLAIKKKDRPGLVDPLKYYLSGL